MSDNEKRKQAGLDAPDLGVTTNSVSDRDNIMSLAESLIHTAPAEVSESRDQILSLHVGRPGLLDHFRTHPTLHGDVSLLKIKGQTGEEVYAVTPKMLPAVDNAKRYTLFFCMTRTGSSFLWPVLVNAKDGYSRAARQIAVDAMGEWCRIVPDHANSSYKKRPAPHCKEEPGWPEGKTFTELLVLAFGDGRIIDSEEHPIMKLMWLK